MGRNLLKEKMERKKWNNGKRDKGTEFGNNGIMERK
jgi:hypothetical protein